MNVSVIIPTLNEEQTLPHLLDDFRNQTVKDFEVIVADANSSDRTVEVAKAYKAQLVKGGLPAVGRNSGAKIARGEFLFFLDADVRVPTTFIEQAYDEIEERYLDLATCELIPLSERPVDKFLHDVVNSAIKLGQFVDPHAPGCCILVSKRLFNRVDGFDETLKLAEDHNFAKRASKFCPVRVLESTYIHLSVRRLEKESRIELMRKYLQVELYRTFRGEIRDDIVEYEFGNFTRTDKAFLEKTLEEGRTLLETLNRNYQQFISEFQGKPRDNATSMERLETLKEQFEGVKQHLKTMLTLPPKKP